VTTSTTASDRLQVYLRLAKVDVPDLWVGVPLAWSLLPRAVASEPRTILLLALFLTAVVSATTAAVALDDVQGSRDGTDGFNYRSQDSDTRKRPRKPLLDGALHEREAIRFGMAAAAVSVAMQVAAAVIASAWWVLLFSLCVCVAAIQYSAGIKVSYAVLGGGEFVLAVAMASTVVLPYALITEAVDARCALEAGLLGLWMAQISMCSNTHDAGGDRQAGRRTLAAALSPSQNRNAIAVVFGLGLALALGGFGIGLWPVWFSIPLAPSWAVQARQLLAGIRRREWLRARALGLLAFRLGVGGLILGNLLATR
jgi:1,4-dihydroxy-2-naphthoate polyprenyltransferase